MAKQTSKFTYLDEALGEPDLNDLVTRLTPLVGEKWIEIAIFLNIDRVKQLEIESSFRNGGRFCQYLREVLHAWRNNQDEAKPYKWSTILCALEAPLLGAKNVATVLFADLAKKISPSHSLRHPSDETEEALYTETEQEIGSDVSKTSEYQSQHSAVPELYTSCGCGDCSVKDWLEKGCKKPGKLENYPKLDVKSLSIEEQEILLNRLDRETKTVQKKFASLTLSIVRWLSSHNVPVEELQLFLGSLTTFSPISKNTSKLLCEEMNDINACTGVHGIFKILSNFWSWINYELLEDIASEFCNEDHDIQEKFEIYLEKVLEPFLRRSVIEISSSSYSNFDISNRKKLTFKLGTDMESHSGNSIRLIRAKLADILGVEHEALQIAMVKDGCMEITFVVPDVIHGMLFPALPEDVQIQLAGFEVESKSCIVEQISSPEFSYTLSPAGERNNGCLYKSSNIPLSAIPELVAEYSPQSSLEDDNIISTSLVKHALVRQDTTPFTFNRQDSNDDNKSSSSTIETRQQSVSMIDQSSGYLTGVTASEITTIKDQSHKTSAGSVTKSSIANIYSVTSTYREKPYFGVANVCKICFEVHKAEYLLYEFQCYELDQHSHSELICVAWNKFESQWEKIRKQPNFVPKRGGYRICYRNDRCRGEFCTYAHSGVERRAWNYELRKRRNSGEDTSHEVGTLLFSPDISPGEDKPSTLSRKSWKVNFMKRLTYSKRNQPKRLDLPLTRDNYKIKFYNLLCFEEKEHINILTKKCDGKYELVIFDEAPEFLMDKESDQASRHVYGYLTGQTLTSSIIDYATQASEAVYFVKFDLSGRKSDICEVQIHSHSYSTTEEKLFVYFSTAVKRTIQQNFESCGDNHFMIDVEFEVKHYYFNTLHNAVVKLRDSMTDKMLPTKQDFSVFPIEQFDWSLYSEESTFLHLDRESQILSLQRIVSFPSKVPFILSGPFGSGKTRVLACAALYFSTEKNCREPAKIMICAHHQQSTETFIETYFGRFFKEFPTIKAKVQVIHIVRGKIERRSGKYSEYYKTLREFKRWFNNGYDASKPLVIVSTYMNSLSLYEILQIPGFGFFTHFLLDEAAQVREPEAIAPLSMATREAKIVLAGDQFQVGPNTLVFGSEAVSNGLNKSLLERLLKLYDGYQVSKQYFTQLNVIYRCHHSLLALPGKLFYHDSLQPGKRHPKVHSGPNGYKFVSTILSKPSAEHKRNVREALILVQEVLSYMEKQRDKDMRFKPFQVCIISSSRNQLNTIKEVIKGNDRYNPVARVRFLPSYIIQGYEFKAIFLSLFGSLTENGKEMSNITKSLCNPIVFNTVITRATTLVVAVGDPRELLEYESQNPDMIKPWSEYLKICDNESSANTSIT